MAGKHLLKSWSSTQPTITLSSGEAELHGVVRGGAVGLGFLSLLADLGVKLRLRLWTDSTASQGICGRQGLGKVRHLDVQDLWVQQRIRNGDFSLHKIEGEKNPGDLFTKASLTRCRIRVLLKLLGCEFRDGRPESAPALRMKGGTPKVLNTTGPRWSEDDEEDFAKIHDEEEVLKILKREGLPHREVKKYPAQAPRKPFPEVEEAVDPMVAEGEAMGRNKGGRGGLPQKLSGK